MKTKKAKRASVAKNVQTKLDQIEMIKREITTARDTLRSRVEELEDILGCLDVGVEDIESGMRTIGSGLDSISEFL